MRTKHHLHHIWLILAVYGVYFAIFSGIEEVLQGKYWKIIVSLYLGLTTYLIIEYKTRKK